MGKVKSFSSAFLPFSNRMNKREEGNLNFNLISFTLKFPVIIILLVFFSLIYLSHKKFIIFVLLFRSRLRCGRGYRAKASLFHFALLSIPKCNISSRPSAWIWKRLSPYHPGNWGWDSQFFTVKYTPLNPSWKCVTIEKRNNIHLASKRNKFRCDDDEIILNKLISLMLYGNIIKPHINS